jgi:simple sugar transport system permease protein
MALVWSTISLSMPLVLAAMGGLVSERSGVMNIGLEGTMLGSCCTVAIVGSTSQSPAMGLLAGLAVGVALMSLHAVLTQAYAIDHIISGMAINALSLGGTSFAAKRFIDDAGAAQGAYFPAGLYWPIAAVIVAGLWVYLSRTKGGVRLMAVGNDPDKSRQMGVEPVKIRYLALAATGVFCGLAGAMIVSNSRNFADNMTAGRGYIALAALIIGSWRPVPTFLACVGFGLVDALQLSLQGTKMAGANVPPEFWNIMPYFVTLVALAGLLGKNRAPSGLGKP